MKTTWQRSPPTPIYGYPLVTNLREVRKFTREGFGSLPAAPFNSFSHATALAGPITKAQVAKA